MAENDEKKDLCDGEQADTSGDLRSRGASFSSVVESSYDINNGHCHTKESSVDLHREIQQREMLAVNHSTSSEFKDCDEISNIATESLMQLQPPDGGYGWIIALSTVIIMTVLPSLCYCFGLAFLEIQIEHSVAPYSLLHLGFIPAVLSIRHTLGPACTKLGDIYGPRLLAITGQVIIVFGLIISTGYSITFFFLYFGFFLIGIGLSITNPQNAVITRQYFTDSRTVVSAITSTVSILLSIGVPFLLQFFFTEFTSTLGFVLWSVVVVQSIAASALLQPVRFHMVFRPVLFNDRLVDESNGGKCQHTVIPIATENDDDKFDETCDSKDESSSNKSSDEDDSNVSDSLNITYTASPIEEISMKSLNNHRNWNNPSVDQCRSPTEKYPPTRIKSITSENNIDLEVMPVIMEENDQDSMKSFTSHEYISFLRKSYLRSPSRSRGSGFSEKSFMSVSYTSDSVYYSAENIPFIAGESCNITRNSLVEDNFEDAECGDSEKNESLKYSPVDVINILKQNTIDFFLVNYNIFTKKFLICCTSSSIMKLVYNVALIFLPMRGGEVGNPNLAPILLGSVVLAELISKILTAIITSHWCENVTKFHTAGHFISALGCLGLALSPDKKTLVLASLVFGVGQGMALSSATSVLLETVGMNMVSTCSNIIMMCAGIAGLLILPLAGLIAFAFDSTSSVFAFLFLLSILPAILWTVRIICTKNEQEDEEENSPQDLTPPLQ